MLTAGGRDVLLLVFDQLVDLLCRFAGALEMADQHLVGRITSPVDRLGWRVRIQWILRRIIVPGVDVDLGPCWQVNRLGKRILPLPIEVPIFDPQQRFGGLIGLLGPDFHLASQHVHVRHNVKQRRVDWKGVGRAL